MTEHSDGLPDIHIREVNAAKRRTQLKLLHRVRWGFQGAHSLTVVCLPGIACWDIDYFLRYRRMAHIIGIERDPEIADKIGRKYQEEARVEVYCGELAEFLMTVQPGEVDLFYLDYCSPLTLVVMQDIDILLKGGVLAKKGKCLVSFYNAREKVADVIAQRRLFDDLDAHFPSGEDWRDVGSDRRRCIAFNSLLYRYRLYPTRGAKASTDTPLFVGTTAVNRWHRYKTVKGSMLTGYFTVTSVGERLKVPDWIAFNAPDKWYVRGKFSIEDVVAPTRVTALQRESRAQGGDMQKAHAMMCISDFYREHGYTPTKEEMIAAGGPSYRGWNRLIRELGLCPNINATLDDIRGELRRIHKREGVVTPEHLQKAKLLGKYNNKARRNFVSREAVIAAYGQCRSAYGAMLDEMNIPHDFRTANQLLHLDQLREWVHHLESGGKKTHSPHYTRMVYRGFREYGDAVRELRRLERRRKDE